MRVPCGHRKKVHDLRDGEEGAVAVYNGPAFNSSPGAAGLAFIAGSTGPGIELDSTEVEAVVSFLRVINALENLRS